jgi:hypothetical protein
MWVTVVDGDAAGREDQCAVGELGFVASGRGLSMTSGARWLRLP